MYLEYRYVGDTSTHNNIIQDIHNLHLPSTTHPQSSERHSKELRSAEAETASLSKDLVPEFWDSRGDEEITNIISLFRYQIKKPISSAEEKEKVIFHKHYSCYAWVRSAETETALEQRSGPGVLIFKMWWRNYKYHFVIWISNKETKWSAEEKEKVKFHEHS